MSSDNKFRWAWDQLRRNYGAQMEVDLDLGGETPQKIFVMRMPLPRAVQLLSSIPPRVLGEKEDELKPSYEIVSDEEGKDLVIRDIGPWNSHKTVTNGAEEVVEELVSLGLLPEGRRLLYYDSEGSLSQLLVRGARFVGFADTPRRDDKEEGVENAP